MRPSAFVRVVQAQHARTDGVVASSYLTALAAVIHMATLAVTQVQYKVDGRVPNLGALARLPVVLQHKVRRDPPIPFLVLLAYMSYNRG